MKRLILLVIVITSLPLAIAAQTTQEDVSEIMKTLSADEMKGRKVFTPHIEEAADFIAEKFSEFGLQTLDEEDDYLQEFHMESISLENSRITVDGKALDTDNFFVLASNRNIRWSENAQTDVKSIPTGADFRSEFSNLNQLEEDLIVFVDPTHSDMFQRYRPYFSRPNRSFSGESQHDKVFIMAEEPENFSISLDKNVEQLTLANVAGKIEGKRKDEIVLFSAHYDHIGVVQPVEGDSIANGANDNASGTTAVIELAGYFSQQPQPERTLLFVAFTAEEAGGYGSKYFSRQLHPDNIVAMFNIEMIGKPFTGKPNSAWITGFEKSSFGKLLQKSTEGMDYTFLPDPYPNQNLFYRSDNATLARLGVPAHSISTTPIDVDPDYHRVTDEIETVDLQHITDTINAIARAAEGIISGEHTPTRVDRSMVN
ncbi:M20/M25/M40 family metallo-hydrolase [Balneolaceae bacterium YR4-1]|uniref:M20/M25/M40 family metallo-hydrolase n=1 Tax=Halalkalibaculum roseum TaxID=2709311 RepID=A0A6M1SX98_9BACT|nr:M20/M25/M40 family metallo-hydrolase [Halalkalibaculum roseum]NGP77660.1 M20/M25/M40 family metallo-hydrolase [Halalkalibaculum roseum]